MSIARKIWKECRDTPPNYQRYCIRLIRAYLAGALVLGFTLGVAATVLTFWVIVLTQRVIRGGKLLPLIIQMARR